MRRGGTFGFDVGVIGKYPVTVVAYGEFGQELGSITVKTAPPDGERWYVVVWDSENGLAFAADIRWPEGVQAVDAG